MKHGSSLLLIALILAAAASAFAQSETKLTAQRHRAFRTITAGKPVQAANDLLTVIRALPPGNATVAENATGNLQLLVFDVVYLMDDETREAFFTKTLEPEKREIDAFIVTIYESYLLQNEEQTEKYLERLWPFVDNPNRLIDIVTLRLLADPSYTIEKPIGDEARYRFAARYPNLRITRMVLSLPMYFYSQWPGGAMNWARAYLGKEPIPGRTEARPLVQAEKNIMTQGPYIANIAPILEDLGQGGSAPGGVEAMTKLLREDDDWVNRYGYLRTLEPFLKKPSPDSDGYWKPIKPTLRLLAERKPVTPDVYRAWVMLCRAPIERGYMLEAGFWADRLLTQQERPCEPIDRVLYEECVRTCLRYAAALLNRQLSEESAEAYNRIADYYPNSALAAKCRALASDARAAAEKQGGAARVSP